MNETMPLIMIVEDEPKLAALLADYLRQAGYRTAHVADGAAAVEAIRQAGPDLVLLDLMLPGRDGVDICRELRADSAIPIVMVTARVEEIDRLLGLRIGADDYICKPFSPREAVARVQAILRRSAGWKSASAHASAEAADPLVIDDERHAAVYHGVTLDLTPVEFRLLKTLHDNKGRVYSRDQLMQKVYQDYRVVTDRTVDSHVKNLRRKLDQAWPQSELIRSIYGVGYKYEE